MAKKTTKKTSAARKTTKSKVASKPSAPRKTAKKTMTASKVSKAGTKQPSKTSSKTSSNKTSSKKSSGTAKSGAAKKASPKPAEAKKSQAKAPVKSSPRKTTKKPLAKAAKPAKAAKTAQAAKPAKAAKAAKPSKVSRVGVSKTPVAPHKPVKSPYSAPQLKPLRKALLERRTRVMGDLNLMGDEALRAADPDVDAESVADHGSDAYERNLTLGLMEQDAKLLRKMEEALTAMDAGTYGVCSECEGSIPLARLEALPFATTCVPCQTRAESGY